MLNIIWFQYSFSVWIEQSEKTAIWNKDVTAIWDTPAASDCLLLFDLRSQFQISSCKSWQRCHWSLERSWWFDGPKVSYSFHSGYNMDWTLQGQSDLGPLCFSMYCSPTQSEPKGNFAPTSTSSAQAQVATPTFTQHSLLKRIEGMDLYLCSV